MNKFSSLAKKKFFSLIFLFPAILYSQVQNYSAIRPNIAQKNISPAAVAQPKKNTERNFLRSIIQETNTSFTIECEFERPEFFSSGNETKFRQRTPQMSGAFEIGGSYLYGFSAQLNIKSGARVEVLSVSEEEIFLGDLEEKPALDIPLSKEKLSLTKKSSEERKNFPQAEISYLGKMRTAEISALNFYPYRYDWQTKKIHCTKKIKVRIRSTDQVNLVQVQMPVASVFDKRDFSFSKNSNNSLLSANLIKSIPTAPDGFQYKLIIDREGVVRVSAAALEKAGVPIRDINSRSFRLYNKGVEIPIYVYDRNNERLDITEYAEEYIEFFGEPNRKNFSNPEKDIYGDNESVYNVYTLTWGSGLGRRIVEESGDIKVSDPNRAIDLRGQSFTSRVFKEQDKIHTNFGGAANSGNPAKDVNTPANRADYNYWERVGTNQSVRLPVELPFPDLNASQPISLKVMLRGATNLQNTLLCNIPEHSAEVDLNQQRALAGSWSGFQPKLLNDKENLLVPEIPSTAAIDAERSVVTIRNIFSCNDKNQTQFPSFFVNWLEINYRRLYKAYNNNIEFSVPDGADPGLYTFTIENFSSPNIIIYRKGISRIINAGLREVKLDSLGFNKRYTVNFQLYAASSQEKFFAATEDQIIRPKEIRKDKATSLAANSNDADYIAITDRDIFDPLSKDSSDSKHPILRLKDIHAQHTGNKVMIVDVQDIFDEFNYGIFSREAIRNFLQYSYRNWQVIPRYAVIWGNAAQIPPDYWQTVDWGYTPTDYTYGFLDGSFRDSEDRIIDDVFPEIIVSRIPVNSKEQAKATVDKIEQYIASPNLSAYKSSAIMIAGSNRDFEIQSDKVVSEIPSSVSVRRVYVGNTNSKYYGGTSELISQMNEGTSYINYMGHGGGAIWDDAGLMEPAQVKEISNKGKYFVVSSPTCFTGAYETERGLLTAFILEQDRGAIAAWGNSGFGWTYGSADFARSLGEEFFKLENRGKTIGQLFVNGKVNYFSSYGTYNSRGLNQDVALTMVLQCTLMGDPALKFNIATTKIPLILEKSSVDPGENINGSIQTPFAQGQGVIELYDAQYNLIEGTRQPIAIASATTNFSLQLPPDYKGTFAGVRVYANDYTQQNQVEGSASFSTGGVVFSELSSDPHPPVKGRDLFFTVKIASKNPVITVSCHIIVTDKTGIIFDQNIPCSLDPNGFYRTNQALPGNFIQSGTIQYTFEANTGEVSVSETKVIFLNGKSEISAFAMNSLDSLGLTKRNFEYRKVNPDISMYTTAQGAQLGMFVYNWGEADASGVGVRFYYTDQNNNEQLLANISSVSIPAKGKAQVFVPANQIFFNKTKIRVEVLPDAANTDDMPGNNIAENFVSLASFQYDPAVGTTLTGSNNSAVGKDNLVTIESAAGNSTEKFLLSMDMQPRPQTIQPGIKFVRLVNNAYTITISTDSTKNISPVSGKIKFWYDASDNTTQIGTPSVYKFNRKTGLWTKLLSNVISSGIVEAQAALEGMFAVAVSDDATAPNISFSVEGQFFSNRGAVPPNPKITFVASDENGVQTASESINIELDGKRIPASDYTIIDSTVSPTSTSILYRPSLSQGMHTVCISVLDNNGVESNKTCAQMNVSTELALDVFGSFPNPFKETVFLAYEIKGVNSVDEVEIKFYTASGRLMRRLFYPSTNPRETFGLLQGGTGIPTSLGYHEAWWNGTDEVDSQIANGVYFYKIRVKSGDKVVEQQGRLARVR